MSLNERTRIDVEELRRAHPIVDVVAASGVDLHPRGPGFVGRCPFHDDATPSLSVGGVPDRFHCFGCSASGDVIDYVQRRYGLGFLDAVKRLDGTFAGPHTSSPAHPPTHKPSRPLISTERAYQVNALAWDVLASPVGERFASAYLRHHRQIDLRAFDTAISGPLAGWAGPGWTRLVDELRRRGVTHDELLAADLAQTSRTGSVIDTLRDRLILPVRTNDGQISGFIGRDLTDDPRAPKYRNPAHTVVFDKSLILYRTTLTPPRLDATVVVVEGPLDALALAASAAQTGAADQIIPVSANGTAVSAAQAAQVCALAAGDIVLALDNDDAGRTATVRWVDQLARQQHRLPRVATLPRDADPAQWLAEHGRSGLTAFTVGEGEGRPRMPGPELVRACLPRARDKVRDTAHEVADLAHLAPAMDAVALLTQVEQEMSRQGWNPDGVFSRYLRSRAVPRPPAWPTSPTPPWARPEGPDPHILTR